MTKKSYNITHFGGKEVETMINIFSYKTGTVPQTNGIANKVTNKKGGDENRKIREFLIEKEVEYEAL